MRRLHMGILTVVALVMAIALWTGIGCGPPLPIDQPTPSASPPTTPGSVEATTTTGFVVHASSSVLTTGATAPVLSSTTSEMPVTSTEPPSTSTTSANGVQQKLSGDAAAAVFSHPTKVDNTWFPLQPGAQFVYRGFAEEDGGERIPHELIFVVTDLIKTVGGVDCVVVWDRDLADGDPEEAELTFFAQDDSGKVWQLGEYPEAYEDGRLVEAPAWLHGVAGAKAGTMMQADPRPGTPSYAEGWGPAVQWGDRGQVTQSGVSTTVPAGRFNGVMVIKEFSEDHPGAYQLKYYVAGTGLIRVGWGGDDDTKETLELVTVTHLDGPGLTAARQAALQLEAHAYQISKNVYGTTAPARTSGG